jgi:hypothetical protein
MEIRTIEDLIAFVDKNYENLTHSQYVEICRTTMHLYEYRKPDTKEATIKRLTDLYSFSLNYSSIQDMPLFLD